MSPAVLRHPTARHPAGRHAVGRHAVGTRETSRAPEVASRARARRLRRRAGDSLLTALAVLGLISVVAAVAAHLLGYQLVMFASGSMSPTIPAGSLALTRTTPAAALQVGQVVTVHRPQVRPITHRVVAIDAVPGSSGERSVRLRGDANSVDDATPYRVSQADVLLTSVPGGAPWVDALMRPQTRAALSLLVAAVVLWGFWPRRRPRPTPHPAPTEGRTP